MGVIFSKHFWNQGAVHEELKMGLEMILKIDASIKRHFKNDPIFGDRLISAIDDHANLILDECESAYEPQEIESHFSMKHFLQQVERASFQCEIPSAIDPK